MCSRPGHTVRDSQGYCNKTTITAADATTTTNKIELLIVK